MFDTMTMTKVTGAVCGTFLVYLLGGWAAETIYHSGGGHGDHHEQAYVIEVPETGGADEPVEEEVDFSVMMASATVDEGEGLWRNCRSCHALEPGVNGVGPSLYGVVDRAVGSADGYGYSGALVAVAETWTTDNLNAFLENPSSFAPGTAMGYNGMRSAEDRANLITFLDSLDD